MTALVTAWAEVIFVVAVLVAGTALLVVVGHRRLGRGGWLLGAAMLFVVAASSGGVAALIEIEVLMRTGASGMEMWRAKRGLSLSPLFGCAAFFAVLSLWRTNTRRHMAVFVMLGGALAVALQVGDRMAREEAFLIAVDLQPPSFPTRLSAAGPNPRTVPLPSHIAAREVALGTTIDERGYERPRACMSSRDGVWCFLADEVAPQVDKVMDGDVSAVSVGRDFGCGRLGARLTCWGAVPAALVARLGRFVRQVAVAGRSWCLLGEELQCGDDGRMVSTPNARPVQVEPGWHDGVCLLDRDGEVSCLQLEGAGVARYVDGVRARSIAAGGVNACATTTDLKVFCWRDELRGAFTPHRIGGLTKVSAVTVGAGHRCAIDGAVLRCWGDNHWGQLGDGTTEARASPVASVTGVRSVAAGDDTTCAVANRGVVCWGRLATYSAPR